MKRAKKLAAWSSTFALVLGITLPQTSVAQRGALRVAVGELGGEPEHARSLDRAIHDALGSQADLQVTETRRAHLVLRGSIVRWDARSVRGEHEVHCEVSLIVSEARGGAIRAMLRGRAGARGGGDLEHVSQDALRAAVRGALRPLSTQGTALARAS